MVASTFAALQDRVSEIPRLRPLGRITRIVGLVMEATGLELGMGALCRVTSLSDERSVLAEVVGFHERGALLMPLGDIEGLHPGATVSDLGRNLGVRVGNGLLGRVVNALGAPIDGLGKIDFEKRVPLSADPPNPLERERIETPFVTGVRAIDGLLTVGRGQRVGIFAGSGVGKSVLLGMIARKAESEVNVIALLGERGREVREFVENSLGPEGLARSVVIVATGDESALLRARGALVATAIAEWFRDQGKQVLLMVDSVTRVAMAWREIGLAVGEPPTTKGYPPSVFARLPQLVERAGNGIGGGGSITAFYTVLVEGDDHADPIADSARAILDGHIVLARRIADAGRFPAVDVEASVSRVMHEIVAAPHLELTRRFRRVVAAYESHRDLIAIGAYQRGSDPRVDEAIALWPRVEQYLQQDMRQRVNFDESVAALQAAVGEAARQGEAA